MDDALLVQQAVAGDRQAFAAIYDRYAARIYDFARRTLRDPDEAADVLQDTFLAAGARLHQLRDPAKLRPWLYAIARHRALRSIEHQSRQRPLDDVEVTSTDADPADVAADRASGGELAALVAAAAEGLSARDQVVLELHLRQGLEGQELGDAIGVSADHAYVLVSRLRDQVERSLGALLVARQGRDDCPDLDALLRDWDGRYTPVWRKRVARHVEGCEVCSEGRRRLLTPAGLLGGVAAAAPAFALPPGVRDRVMEKVDLCSHTGPAWPGGSDGFPPPLVGGGGRRRRTASAALAAAVVVLLLLGVVVGGHLVGGGGGDGAPADVAAVGSTSSSTLPVATGVLGAGPGIAPTSTVAGSGPAPAPPTPGPTLPPGNVDPGPDPAPDPAATTVPPAPTTTAPPDAAPPTLTSPVATPGTIRAGSGCSNDDPRVTTVRVRATDPSGVAAVVLEVGSLPSVVMEPTGNGVYEATIGPLAGSVGAPVVVPLTARATDGAGNAGLAGGALTLRCDPTPG